MNFISYGCNVILKGVLALSKYYSIHKFSKIIGVSAQTLRNWDNNGKLHPHHTTLSGYRYYSEEQLNNRLNYIKGIATDIDGTVNNVNMKIIRDLEDKLFTSTMINNINDDVCNNASSLKTIKQRIDNMNDRITNITQTPFIASSDIPCRLEVNGVDYGTGFMRASCGEIHIDGFKFNKNKINSHMGEFKFNVNNDDITSYRMN